MTTFTDLGLAEPLLKAIVDAGYETPTPIQTQAIPPILQGSDLLGIAQTGTGKTAAFALPILNRLAADRKPAPRKGCRVLVLSPTRELATQIAESFRTYGRHLGFSVAVVFGGVSERPQIQALARGVDVLVATPGRLLDHTHQRTADLSGTEIFVLDEADQMLDLGFFKPIRRIVAQLPMKRQSLFFSATMPAEIEELTRELLRDPVKVAVAPAAKTVDRVEQRVIHIEKNKKKSLLVELLADQGMARTLVFTRTKRGADRVAKHLDASGVRVSAIHGNKSQNQREHSLDSFRDGRIRVLVATDIAARGIDIDQVTHVVNFDLPEVPEAYVHRIGRTARAGASGFAVAFCDGEERGLLRDIERLTRLSIPSEDRRNDASLATDRPAGSDRLPGGRERPERERGGSRDDDRPARRARPDGREQRSPVRGGGRPTGDRDARNKHNQGERPAPRHGDGHRSEDRRGDRRDDRRADRGGDRDGRHGGGRPQHHGEDRPRWQGGKPAHAGRGDDNPRAAPRAQGERPDRSGPRHGAGAGAGPRFRDRDDRRGGEREQRREGRAGGQGPGAPRPAGSRFGGDRPNGHRADGERPMGGRGGRDGRDRRADGDRPRNGHTNGQANGQANGNGHRRDHANGERRENGQSSDGLGRVAFMARNGEHRGKPAARGERREAGAKGGEGREGWQSKGRPGQWSGPAKGDGPRRNGADRSNGGGERHAGSGGRPNGHGNGHGKRNGHGEGHRDGDGRRQGQAAGRPGGKPGHTPWRSRQGGGDRAGSKPRADQS